MDRELFFSIQDSKVIWKKGNHTLWVESLGQDAIRVRSTLCRSMPVKNWSLILPSENNAEIYTANNTKILKNGLIEARINHYGSISFYNTLDDRLLCAEKKVHCLSEDPRTFKYKTDSLYLAQLSMESFEDEKIYGLGQHKHGYLNQKGCVIDLIQVNSEVSIPFMISSRGYGFIWHNPAIGRVELGNNGTRWIANTTSLIDYVVIAGEKPSDILKKYMKLTGLPPMLPYWASGFWQSRLRYKTQEQLLDVARQYKKKNLPISVIVIDYFHWPSMGDYNFDSKCWPDPRHMVEELNKMDIKVMVSIWPTVNLNSKNFEEFEKNGYLVQTKKGFNVLKNIKDTYSGDRNLVKFIDTTNPATRKYLWKLVKKNYFDFGIKIWWLDAIEPETNMFLPHDNFIFYAGDGEEVALLYPLGQQECFYQGMKGEGEKEIITLCRSGFLGSQKYGAAIWSGDIDSTFESLRVQVRAGLNMAISGIPWWTTDIGGFKGGNIDSNYFKELIIRWFQFGVFCPIFRLHGYRFDNNGDYLKEYNPQNGGADNEVWSFGKKVYYVLQKYMKLRERLRPYIMDQMKLTHKEGIPIMRPLFFDFYKDQKTYDIEDEFMFGPDILVAPILYEGSIERMVYIPYGTKWIDPYNGTIFEGGNSIKVDAPIEKIPIFLKGENNILRDNLILK